MLVVGLLGEDATADELVLGGVRSDRRTMRCGVGVADAGEGLELVGGGGVDVELERLRRRRRVVALGVVCAMVKMGAAMRRSAAARSV